MSAKLRAKYCSFHLLLFNICTQTAVLTEITRNEHMGSTYGWERNFVPKKFRGIDSERFPLFRGRKHSFRGIPSSAEEPIPKLGTERNGTEWNSAEKISFTKQQQNNNKMICLYIKRIRIRMFIFLLPLYIH